MYLHRNPAAPDAVRLAYVCRGPGGLLVARLAESGRTVEVAVGLMTGEWAGPLALTLVD